MKTNGWITTLVALAVLIAALAAQPTASAAQPAGTPQSISSASAPALPPNAALDRMTALFDGKTLSGWECSPANWSIADGAMRGTGAWCLALTKGDYGSFRLLVTSRVVIPEKNKGNAHLGILFWGSRPTPGNYTPRHTGMLNLQPPYGSIWDYGTNKNVPVEHIIPKNDNRLRWHDWHTSEIVANIKTGEIRMAVDGVELMRYKAPDPAILKKGPIALQVHSGKSVVEYKDIKVEVDPPDDRLLTVK